MFLWHDLHYLGHVLGKFCEMWFFWAAPCPYERLKWPNLNSANGFKVSIDWFLIELICCDVHIYKL